MRPPRIITLHSELVVIDEIDLDASKTTDQLVLGRSRVYRASSPRWELLMNMVVSGKLVLLVKTPILSVLWISHIPE